MFDAVSLKVCIQSVVGVPDLLRFTGFKVKVYLLRAGCFLQGFTTFGCVFKDGPYSVYFSACKKEEVSTEPVLAEALATRWCLHLAKEKGLQDVIIQSDALAVVKCFRGSNSLASIDLIVLDCKALMKDFSSVSANYVCRNLKLIDLLAMLCKLVAIPG